MSRTRRVLAVFAMLTAAAVLAWSAIRPSNERDWVAEQGRLPTAVFDGDRVVVNNVRNFDWTIDGAPMERWAERSYDLDRIESVWFVLTPFSTDWRGPAHAFISFGFADSQYVSISVEARKEVGETYSILKGLLKRFELTYIVGDERDLIGLRASRQQDEIQLYPIRATQDAARRLFTAMLERANELAARPVFYGSLRNNCTTAILSHVNDLGDVRIRYDWRVLLPGYSDELALELGLIDTDLELNAARQRYHVNDRVLANMGHDDFSVRIRSLDGDTDNSERMDER